MPHCVPVAPSRVASIATSRTNVFLRTWSVRELAGVAESAEMASQEGNRRAAIQADRAERNSRYGFTRLHRLDARLGSAQREREAANLGLQKVASAEPGKFDPSKGLARLFEPRCRSCSRIYIAASSPVIG